MAGKGSKPRPVDRKKWDTNWDDIFGKKQKKLPATPTVEELKEHVKRYSK